MMLRIRQNRQRCDAQCNCSPYPVAGPAGVCAGSTSARRVSCAAPRRLRRGARLKLIGLCTIWLVVLTALTGCGFQLRGQVDLPPQLERTYVAGLSRDNEMGADIRRRLEANGVEVVESRDQATAILRMGGVTRTREVLAVNEQGKAQEFVLTLTTTMEVVGHDGGVLLPRQPLQIRRDFIFDQNEVLGKATEAQLIYEDMEKSLARLIMIRLLAVGSTPAGLRLQETGPVAAVSAAAVGAGRGVPVLFEGVADYQFQNVPKQTPMKPGIDAPSRAVDRHGALQPAPGLFVEDALSPLFHGVLQRHLHFRVVNGEMGSDVVQDHVGLRDHDAIA